MYEYKVVPAPQRAAKVKGLKTSADRFAHTLAERINAEAAGGWQFLRTETLQCETRGRFGGIKQSTETVMVFAREVGVTRPDASAALAAVQEPEAAVDAPRRRVVAAPVAAPAAAPRVNRSVPPVAPQEIARYEDEGYDEDGDEGFDDEIAEPELAPAPQRPARRQEPLFRSGAMLRSEMNRGEGRSEPQLRPRANSADDE